MLDQSLRSIHDCNSASSFSQPEEFTIPRHFKEVCALFIFFNLMMQSQIGEICTAVHSIFILFYIKASNALHPTAGMYRGCTQ